MPGDITGELRKGFRADFLVLDREQPEVLPSWDFEWELVRLYTRPYHYTAILPGHEVSALIQIQELAKLEG